MRVWTIGHGTRPAEELVETLARAGVRTLVAVRRFPGSRRNPQFGRDALAEGLGRAGISYRHAVELGGRRSGEPGEERFACIREAAFRSYAARMSTPAWQEALVLVGMAALFLAVARWMLKTIERLARHEGKLTMKGS